VLNIGAESSVKLLKRQGVMHTGSGVSHALAAKFQQQIAIKQ